MPAHTNSTRRTIRFHYKGKQGDRVLCGDHGEAFGEDGFWGRAVNHPTVQELPIAIFGLNGAPV